MHRKNICRAAVAMAGLSITLLALAQDEGSLLRLARRGAKPPPRVHRIQRPCEASTTHTVEVEDVSSTEDAAQAAQMAVLGEIVKKEGAISQEVEGLAGEVGRSVQAQRDQGLRLLAAQSWLTTKVTEALENPNHHKYLVEVEVHRDPSEVAEAFRAVASANFFVATFIPEFVDGESHTPNIVDAALQGALVDREFKVFEWQFAATDNLIRNLLSETVTKVPPDVTRQGRQLLANTIIVGRVDATSDKLPDRGGTFWCRVRTALKVIKDGRILSVLRFPADPRKEVKGYGRDRDEAAEMALSVLAEEVSRRLPEKMLQDFPRYPTTLQYTLSGAAPEREQEINEIQSRLRTVVGAENLRLLPSTNRTLLLSVTTPFKRAELGARLEAGTPYRVEHTLAHGN